MLRVGMPGQNKFSKFGVLERVAFNTKDFDVCRVCSECRSRTVRFNMMPLQSVFAPAISAAPTFRNNSCDCFSTGIRSTASTTLPFWVVFFLHTTSSRSSHTSNTAILPSTTASFANLELISAFFTGTVKHCFLLFGFSFVRALSRACNCLTSYVRIGAAKQRTANGTNKFSAPALFNLSFGV
mgnify:CR=1 FL=1